MEHTVLPAWALLAYLASGVLFILALRGLSSPAVSGTCVTNVVTTAIAMPIMP